MMLRWTIKVFYILQIYIYTSAESMVLINLMQIKSRPHTSKPTDDPFPQAIGIHYNNYGVNPLIQSLFLN